MFMVLRTHIITYKSGLTRVLLTSMTIINDNIANITNYKISYL